MREQFISQIGYVVSALNNITVSGKQNMLNLSGSIEVLEQVAKALYECEVIGPAGDGEGG